MDCRSAILSSVTLLVSGLLATAAGEDQEGAYYPLHEFIRGRQLIDFPPHVESYLKHANPELSPQVLLDLVVAHGAMRQKEKAQQARARLILDYPGSVQAAYVMGSLANMNEFRELLKASPAAYEAAGQLGYRYLDKLSKAVLYGQSQFGDSFFHDGEFRLLAIYALRESGQGEPERLHAASAAAKPHLLRAGEILLDRRLSPADKLVTLQDCRESPMVRQIQTCCLAQVSSRERISPAIEAVLAENQLVDGELSAALPRIDRLLSQKREAKFLAWRAWALMGGGLQRQAAESLAAVEREFPADPWSKTARDLHAELSAHDDNLAAHAEMLDQVIADIRDNGLSTLQANVRISMYEAHPVRASIGINTDRQEAAASAWQGEQLLVSLHNKAGESRLFYRGEEAIHEYPDMWHSLQPSVRLEQAPDGTVRFNWSFGAYAPSSKSLRDQLLSSPMLCDRKGINDFLTAFTRYGAIPTKPISREGNTVYRWIRPQAASPELLEYEIVVDRRHRLVRMDFGSWVIDDLRYGTSEELTFSQPAWPDLPARRHAKVGPEMLHVLVEIAELVWSDDQESLASQSHATKR